MKKYLVIIFFSFLSFGLFAQNYPQSIHLGETKSFTAEKDTLWIMTGKQFKTAVVKAKELKLANEELKLLKEKSSKLSEQNTERDSLVSIMTVDRDKYMKYWKTSEEDIQTLADKLKWQKRLTKIVGGVGIAGIILAIILI